MKEGDGAEKKKIKKIKNRQRMEKITRRISRE